MAYNYTSVITSYMVPYGHTVDQHVYVDFLCKSLRLKVWQMRLQMLDCVIILRNNAHLHIGTSVTTVFQEYGWEVVYHPLYSPDLSLPDYDPFPKFKELPQGICFSNKWAVFDHDLRDSIAQQKPALTQNRKATGTHPSVYFARGVLHWRVIM